MRNIATQDQRGELWMRAALLHHVAPTCDKCGLRMSRDTFNGMFFCRERGHGGYQTRDQVEVLHFKEMLEELETGR